MPGTLPCLQVLTTPSTIHLRSPLLLLLDNFIIQATYGQHTKQQNARHPELSQGSPDIARTATPRLQQSRIMCSIATPCHGSDLLMYKKTAD